MDDLLRSERPTRIDRAFEEAFFSPDLETRGVWIRAALERATANGLAGDQALKWALMMMSEMVLRIRDQIKRDGLDAA